MVGAVFKQFVAENKSLIPVLRKLEQHGINYGMFSGSYVTLVTGYRETNDLDFLLSDNDYSKVTQLFPEHQVEQKESVLLLYLDKEKKLEFGCKGNFMVNNKKYPCKLTELAQSRIKKIDFGDVKLSLLDPVDTLLAKAILGRGSEVNKHDIRDAKQLLRTVTIEREYLLQRAEEMHVDARVFSTLATIGTKL